MHAPGPRLSLRTWLLGLSLLTTLPLLVFALSVVREFKDFQQRALVEQLERRTGELVHLVAERLQGTLGTLNALAESDAALALDAPRLYAHARRTVQRSPDIRAITLTNEENILFLTTAPLGRTDLPVSAKASLQAALRTQSPSVSGPFMSPVSPIQVVALTVPLVREGQATHALRGILSVDSLNELVAPSRLPEGWIAGIADAEGIAVARSRDPALHVGRPVSDSFRKGMLEGTGEAFLGSTLEGIPTIHLVQPVSGFDWYLSVAVPRALLNAPVTAMLWHMAGLGVLWLGLSLLAAMVFSQYLLRQMQAVARAMEGSTLGPATKLRVTELASVAAQFLASQRSEAAMRGDRDVAVTAREQVQDLYDRAPCGYHSLDSEGRVLSMNLTELQWLGLPLADVQGRAYADFLTPASRVVFRDRFPQFMQDGQIKDLEMDLLNARGEAMPILVSATAVRDAAGHFIASRSTVFDNTEKKRVHAQLEHMARRDALTELSNRRDFYEKAEYEIARCLRSGQPFCVLMVDVDFFKKVNDEYGHAGGDDVLRQLARFLASQLRTVDVPARLGGEEFSVLMPGTPLPEAAHAADRIRTALQATPVALRDGRTVSVTVSMGLAQWHADDADIDATLKRADTALYRAKATGRNRVCTEV
ncbi:diguanylate cyclase [Paracidovorax sp. MALMAid1276]|uniref:diguanylate cyclase n=1 Tax=Paracidovorax sp. MALMAid1276 TaxID=3411631 RepID=UPI003B9B77B9